MISTCDCPGDTPVNGVLIDGVIPSIDTTRGTWASQLFVVNRNGRTSFNIGFQFNYPFYLRHVSVAHLDCGVWNTGFSTVNVYASHTYPAFVTAAADNIGTLSFDDDMSQSCTSLSTISISVQPREAVDIYFIEFSYPSNSPLNWLHVGEISFSDTAPTTSATETITSTSSKSI